MAEAMEVSGELEWGDAYGVGGVQPYQFEPEAAEGEDGDPEAPDRGNQDRRSNRNWRYRYIAYRQLVLGVAGKRSESGPPCMCSDKDQGHLSVSTIHRIPVPYTELVVMEG
ncbi:hypothetical protein Bbelb_393830 [Branchiostoma belcheri]|nr:hypothetical protein Bbelb_393830 [Branchiostoma belcheri]